MAGPPWIRHWVSLDRPVSDTCEKTFCVQNGVQVFSRSCHEIIHCNVGMRAPSADATVAIMSRLHSWWPGLWRNIVLNSIISSSLVPVPLRWRMLRAYGADVRPCRISPGVWIGSRRLTIGEGAYINTACMLSTHAPITIGRRAYLAMGVTVSTSTHEIGPAAARAGKLVTAPVTIGDGCWIGANVTILPGVTIGAGTIIASGAVVTADCAPNSLYAGVPAVHKRVLDGSVVV